MQRKVNKRRGKRNTIKRTVRSVQNNKIKKRKLNKKKVAAVIGLLLMIILLIRKGTKHNKAVEATTEISSEDINNAEKIQTSTVVDNKFEKLDGFKWLKKNAEDYGFVLRYPKDKEDITKIAYESWHWRYVGVEHAKKMNELNMCLEEYVEYLSK